MRHRVLVTASVSALAIASALGWSRSDRDRTASTTEGDRLAASDTMNNPAPATSPGRATGHTGTGTGGTGATGGAAGSGGTGAGGTGGAAGGMGGGAGGR